MNLLAPFFALALVGTMLLEFILYFASTHRLAWLAWLRLGKPEELKLTRPVLDALSATPFEQGVGYRAAPARQIDLGLLRVEPRRDDSFVTHIDLVRGRATVRTPLQFFGFNRSLGLARVDFAVRDETLVASARYTPIPLSPWGLMFMIGTAAALSSFTLPGQLAPKVVGVGVTAVVLSLVVAMVLFLTRSRIKPGVDAVIADVFAAVEGAAKGGPVDAPAVQAAPHVDAAPAVRVARGADVAPGVRVAREADVTPGQPRVRVAPAPEVESTEADEADEADEGEPAPHELARGARRSARDG
jgi:hypothetical protein